jgi:hypothetical protein
VPDTARVSGFGDVPTDDCDSRSSHALYSLVKPYRGPRP